MPPSQTDPGSDTSAETRHRLSAWGVLAAVFIVLLTGCGIWLSVAGLARAAASTTFQYLAVATLIIGIVVGGRLTMRPWREGAPLDRRNVMDWSRSGLWKRWQKP